MPIPQVNDRIKEAPAVMLRAVFAGVGQLLLAADKVRARAAGTGWPPDRTAPKGQSGAQSRWHTLDDTRSGTVPLARERASAANHSAHHPAPASFDGAVAAPAEAQAAASAGPETTAAPAEPEAAAPAEPEATVPPAESLEEPSAVATLAADEPAAAAGPADDAPPLPGYDDLSLPSLRGRLRTLDAAMLRAMLAYEKAHAHRDDVIAMFERRLTKIDAG
jgi:hypothetical protein